MKGIILAGGNGTRLYPITSAVSKQLLPIYDKPLIFYPLSSLMLAGIKDILIITRPEDTQMFVDTLGDGSQWGVSITYKTQAKPEGLPQAFEIAKDFIGDSQVTLILGDNLIHGSGLKQIIKTALDSNTGATIFTTRVPDPERFGVVEFDKKSNKVISIEEKPENPKSHNAIIGLYVFDKDVVNRVGKLTKSARGEYEMVDLHKTYLEENKLKVQQLYRGTVWLDTGTFDSLLEASNFVKAVQKNKDQYVACLEEIAYEMGYIDADKLKENIDNLPNNDYRKYLEDYYIEVVEDGK